MWSMRYVSNGDETSDGTLWAGQPIYFQAAFILDRVKALAAERPEWKETEPFKSVLDGNVESVVGGRDEEVQ